MIMDVFVSAIMIALFIILVGLICFVIGCIFLTKTHKVWLDSWKVYRAKRKNIKDKTKRVRY